MSRLHSGPCRAALPSSSRYTSFLGEFPREKRPTTQPWVPHHHPAEGDPCLPPLPEPGMPRTPASHPCHPLGAWDRPHKPSGDGCIPRRGAGSLLGAHGAAWGTPKALPSSWHCGSPPPAASQGPGVSLPVARLGLHQPRPWCRSQFWLCGAAGVSQGCTGTASALASIPLIAEKIYISAKI